MPEIVRIKVEVDQRSNAAISQIVGLKKTIDEINATHINVQVDNANQLEQVTRKMTAYNNSVARRIQAELQLATAIENRKGEESKAQAAAERRKAAEERTAQSIERTRQAEERTRQAIERTAQTKERTTQITERARLAQERVNTAARQGADANTILGTSLTGLVTRFVSLHMLLSRTVSAFRDALKTMKEVDSALVTIQKTTGFTGQQLDRLTNSAYELANAYGRTATEILNAASVYARAGFKDNLDQMTELSALLQNVGDLEGEVAAKFLIATNAAWKLGGSYESLMSIIDGLNAQTNQAAVDMEGLTSGITVAGSVFSAAGETVQTFAGMLGAGIALTARSGSEVGRGLRTIAMNIRQIKGELDDGEIIDEASISDAAKALHSVGISVADANGELRLTSDVLNDLAGKWDNLTSAEQSYLAQSLAGKRQANILVSLMQNWEEAQRQMELYANGAGSALKENEIYMDSWEAKTKQLSAAWTKFVNNLVDTGAIKKGLDRLITLVEILDSDFGHFVLTIGAAALATAVLGKAMTALKLPSAITWLTSYIAASKAAAAGSWAAESAMFFLRQEAQATLIALAHNPVVWVAGAVAAIYGLVKLYKALNVTAEEYAQRSKESLDSYQQLQSEIDSLNQKIAENNELIATANQLQDSDVYISRLQTENALLETQKQLLEAQASAAKEAANENAKKAYNAASYAAVTVGTGYYYNPVAGYDYQVEATRQGTAIEYASSLLDRMENGEDVSEELSKVLDVLADINSAFDSGDAEAQKYSAEIQGVVDRYNALRDAVAETEKNTKALQSNDPFERFAANAKLFMGMSDADIDRAKEWFSLPTSVQSPDEVEKFYEDLKKTSEQRNKEKEAIKNASSALSEYGANSVEAYDAMKALEEVIPGSTDNLYDFSTATLKVSDELVDGEQALSDFVYGIKQIRNVAREQLEAYDALDTAITALSSAYETNGKTSLQVYDAMEQLNKIAPDVVDEIYDLETAEWKVDAAQVAGKESLLDLVSAAQNVKFDNMIAELERASAAALDLAGSIAIAMPGGYNDQFLEVYAADNNTAIQKLKAQKADWDAWVEQTRGRYQGGGGGGGGGSSASSSDTELARLQNIVKLRKQEVEFLKASGKSQGEINAKQKEVQAALHDLAEYMREIEADEADILSLSTEWWTIQSSMAEVEEDQLKVYQDRVSLLKSQLSLLEAQGADTDTIEAKQREIQDALKVQMDYMESIGASQAEINALATEWYNIENNILDTHKKLFDELKKTIDEYYDAAVTDKEKELQLEEKILEVQKAQIALQNAQTERNVRYFNAASGQWEWGANAKNVQSAKEALSKAQDALVDYQEQAAWAEFKAAWEYIAEKIKSGETTFDQAYKYMKRKMKKLQNKYNVDMGDVLEDSVGAFEGVNKTITELDGQTAEQLGASVKSLTDANTNLGTAVGTLDTTLTNATTNASNAVDAFKSAFDTAKERVENGEWDIDTAFKYLTDAAQSISDTYGVDMTTALNDAIGQMQTVYSGLNGISEAVQEGALTPKEAFDIISKALNAVSEQYGEDIAGEVNRILSEEGGFESGIDDLAAAVASGKLTWDEAFKLLTGAVDQTSEKFGIDGLQGELDAAIQNMGKSGDALEGLWKTIVMNKMRMNSVSWLNLEEQKKQAQAMGDEETVKRLTEQQNALHAENEALGKTIGATYDKSGYWSLNGQNLYDPQADKASGKFDTVTDSGVSPATTGSSKAGGNQDLLDTKWKSSAESHLIPGLGYVNTGEATADLFNLKPGQTGAVARAMLMMYGTDEEKTQYFNGGGIPASLAERLKNQPQDFYYSIPPTSAGIYDIFKGSTNAKGQYSGGAIVYKGGAGDSVVQVKNGKVMATGLQDMGSDIILTPDGHAYRMDSNGYLIDNGETWSNGLGDLATQLVLLTAMFRDQQAMADSGNFSNAQIYGSQFTYDEGGVLHGLGGIKATARDEMILPPDITERILRPTSNAFVDGRMDGLRAMLGMRTEFGSAGSTKIGTQNNGDNYIMNGVSISEGKARSTTVYELAQMARSLGSYQRS